MPVIKYDYLARPYFDENNLVIVYRSIIHIAISASHKLYHSPVNCFVDSGSDFNLMPAHIGEDLGLNIKKGNKTTHIGIGNVGLVAYKHPVIIYLEDYKFKTDVHFSYDHKIPILGRYGFFKYFKKVIFNEKKSRLELEY